MRKYLRSFTAAFFALMLAVIGFVVLIDPYDYWATPKIPGLNRFKPEAGRHFAVIKQRQYDRIRPRTIVAGNSRVEVGFDPKSRIWPAGAHPVYNFGLPGAGLPSVVDSVLRAINRHPPRQIYLGVDFIDFLITEETWREGSMQPHVRPASASALERANELVRTTASLDAVTDAVATILEQRKDHPAHVTPAGFNGLNQYHGLVALEGHSALFRKNIADVTKRFASAPKALRWKRPGVNPNFQALDLIAFECRKRGIGLVVFTYPYHRDMLQAVAAAGYSPALEEWREQLGSWSTRREVAVWDFTRLNHMTTEPVPPPGDTKTRMRWYWEAGHFKPSLGDHLIRTMTAARAV